MVSEALGGTRAQDLGLETSELFLVSWEKVSATWVLENISRLAVPASFHLFQHWSRKIRVYLRSVEKDDHLIQDPPTDDTKKTWLRDDAALLLQIINSIDNEVVGLVNHFCKAFYRSEKEAKSLTTYFVEFKKTYEELNVLLPFSIDIKVQQAQREQMAIMSFLAGLSSEFETAKSHILSSSEISSLKDIFSRVFLTESTPSNQQTNVLVAKGGGGRNNAGRWNNNNDAGRWNNNNDVGKWNHNNDAGMWNNNNNSGRWNKTLGDGTITKEETMMLGEGTITKEETMMLGDGSTTILVAIVRNPGT
ncbi:hypothetical protein KY285_016459 [Solanum tuberosum]|nr:hypothetical protein KY285_016459 [Solanum tuberosum]